MACLKSYEEAVFPPNKTSKLVWKAPSKYAGRSVFFLLSIYDNRWAIPRHL
jgi:hypothetical protein